jgi:NADH:ubiquinone oxidoreductase subunit H
MVLAGMLQQWCSRQAAAMQQCRSGPTTTSITLGKTAAVVQQTVSKAQVSQTSSAAVSYSSVGCAGQQLCGSTARQCLQGSSNAAVSQ